MDDTPEGRPPTEGAELFRLLVDSLTDYAVFVLDGDRRIRTWTPGAERVFGYRADEALGRSADRVFTPEDVAAGVPEREAREALATGRAVDDRWHVRKDGTRFWASGVLTALRDPDGTFRGFAKVLRDLTALKRAEEALREADRQKDVFLATLAHELRNPLAPLHSGLQVLRLANDPATREQARAVMERQLAHLVRLVDDLMDVARIGRGKVLLRREPVDLARVAAEAAEAARPLLDARGHRFTAHLPPAPLPVEADAVRLAQVVTNLLANAAKYTSDGGEVTLRVARDGDGAVVRVTDTGVGIAPEVLPRVFDPFAQADQTRDRSEGGLGIGLALVKGLVELHGGTVAAESGGRGHGSTFTVRLPALPAAAPAPPPTPAANAPDAAPRRVLVVDDNTDAADTMAVLLGMLGHHARVAHDGPAALAAAGEHRPDVVLLDLGMPGMSGYEVARRLRGRPELAGVRLVALTGWAAEDDRRKTREAGFDHHLVKPVDPGELLRYLANPGA